MRLFTMRSCNWSRVEGWLLLLLAAVSRVSRGEAGSCPGDVLRSTERCMYQYRSQLLALPRSEPQQLFMGVDAEVIRHLCTQLRKSVRCAETLKTQCPITEAAVIEQVLAPATSMAELCTKRDVFEVYTRNMQCYKSQSAYSDRCFLSYKAAIEPIMVDVYPGRDDALVHMCRHLGRLVDCVGTNVQLQCRSREAGELAETLVKPAVEHAENCRNRTGASTHRPPKATKSAREVFDHQYSRTVSVLPASLSLLLLYTMGHLLL